jgi:hypothetical protein
MYAMYLEMSPVLLRPDSKGALPSEDAALLSLFSTPDWRRVGTVNDANSIIHAFLFALDRKYPSLAEDRKPAYASSVRRKASNLLKAALSDRDPTWAGFVEEHGRGALEALQARLTKEDAPLADDMLVLSLLEHIFSVKVFPWVVGAGFVPGRTVGVSSKDIYAFIIKPSAAARRWEPLVRIVGTETVGGFGVADDIMLAVLALAQEDKRPYEETILHDSDVVFANEPLGDIVQTVQRDMDMSDLSVEELETHMFDLLAADGSRFLKRSARSLAGLVWAAINQRPDAATAIVRAPSVLTPVVAGRRRMEGDGFLSDRFNIANTSGESYVNQQLRLNSAQSPFHSESADSTAPRDMDVLLYGEASGIYLSETNPNRVRALGKVEYVEGTPVYGGDDINLVGVVTAAASGSGSGSGRSNSSVIKSVSLDAYEDAVATMRARQEVEVVFQAPYHDAEGALQEAPLSARVTAANSQNLQLELPYPVRRREDALLSNTLFYQHNQHNDFLVFPVDSDPQQRVFRVGGPHDAAAFIHRGILPFSTLEDRVWPSLREWIFLNRAPLAECESIAEVAPMLRRMGWDLAGVRSHDMAYLAESIARVSDMRPHLHRSAAFGEDADAYQRKLAPKHAALIKKLYGSGSGGELLEDGGRRLWSHLHRDQVAAFMKSKAYQDAPRVLREVERNLSNHLAAPAHAEDEASLVLHRADMTYTKEYESNDQLAADQGKHIPEWEGTYALCPLSLEKGKPAVQVVFQRFGREWVQLGPWRANGTLRHPLDATVRLPLWTPVQDASALMRLRDRMQRLRAIESLTTIRDALRHREALPRLQEELEEAVRAPFDKLVPTFYAREIHEVIRAEDLDADEGDELVTDFDMLQSYEVNDAVEIAPPKEDLTAAGAAIASICASALRSELPADERRDILEILPTVMGMIVDMMYKKKAAGAPKPSAARGYKQKLAELYPSVEKAAEFEQKYTLLIAAAFIAMLIRILPTVVVAPGLASFELAAINDFIAGILQNTEPVLEGMAIVKVIGDLQSQFIMRTNPVYKARIEAAPMKEASSANAGDIAKPNRFRPPLAPVTDRMARSNKVSTYLQGLYAQFTKVRPNSVNAARKPLPLNSCCAEKVRAGMRYSDSQTEEVKKQRATIEGAAAAAGRKPVAVESIKFNVPRERREDFFKSKTLRVAEPVLLKAAAPTPTASAVALAPRTQLLADLAADNAFLAMDGAFADINTLSVQLEELFVEQLDLVNSVRGVRGLPDANALRLHVVDLKVPRASYPRLLQGLEHFLEYDLRRSVGRAWYGKRHALPGAVPAWAELVLSRTIQNLRPVHVKEADITTTLYAYNYIIVKVMFLLMWSLTVPAGSDLVGRLGMVDSSDMVRAIREEFLKRHHDELQRIGEFFAGLWASYMASITTALTTHDVLKQHAEGLREDDKVAKMGIKANMTAEEREIYDGLKAAGLTHLFVVDVDALDREAAAEAADARVDIDGVKEAAYLDEDWNMDAPNVAAGYIDMDFAGENGDDYGDD